MRTPTAVLVLLLAAGAPVRTAAQAPTRVAAHAATAARADSGTVSLVFTAADALPGAIVSAVLRVPLQRTTEAARFRVMADPGVLLHGASTGVLAATEGAGLLPIAFSVGRDAPAGMTRIARVTVVHADGREWIAQVQSRVAVRPGLALALDSSAVLLARGERVRIGYTLRNTGNAIDTVAFRLQAPAQWSLATPSGAVLAPGAAHSGTLELAAPEGAQVGETQILRLAANGRGSAAAANLAVEVGSGLSGDSRWVQMPATVLVGASDAGAGTSSPLALALDARGHIARDTEASLLVRRAPRDDTPPAFLPYLAGPSVRAELRRGPHHVAAGDLVFAGSALHGGFLPASGVDARAQLGPVTTSVFAGQPFQLDEPARSGHLVRAGVDAALASGTVGVRVADLDRPAGLGAASERTRIATASWEGALLQGLSARAEAGVMQLRDSDGRTRDGVAVEVESHFRRERFGLDARVRRVPATLASAGRAADETFVASTLDLGAGLSLQGWAIRNEVTLLDGTGSTQDGAAAGARWQRGGASARVGVNVSETTGQGLLTGDTRRRVLTMGATAPLGPLLLEASLDAGTMQVRDVESELRQATGRVSWFAGSGSAWIGATHAGGVFGSDLTRVDAGANARRGRVSVDARAGRYLGAGAAGRFDAWLATTVEVDRSTAIVAGLDHTPWNSRGARVSLGVRRALAVPLPLRRQPAVDGMLFEDRNGNLVPDAGEPPLPGVRVRMGSAQAVSDEHGRFRFYDAPRGTHALRIDAATLGAGRMLPPGSPIMADRHVAVPVHHAAALHIDLFIDHDGDGRRDAGEPAAEGAALELVDARGRTRIASADADGTVRFAALAPGTWAVRAAPAAGLRTAGARPVDVVLEAGTATRLEVAVPFRAREVRFGPTGAPPPTAAAAGVAAALQKEAEALSGTPGEDARAARKWAAAAAPPPAEQAAAPAASARATSAGPAAPVQTATSQSAAETAIAGSAVPEETAIAGSAAPEDGAAAAGALRPRTGQTDGPADATRDGRAGTAVALILAVLLLLLLAWRRRSARA